MLARFASDPSRTLFGGLSPAMEQAIVSVRFGLKISRVVLVTVDVTTIQYWPAGTVTPGVGKTASARNYGDWDKMEVALGPPPYRYAELPRAAVDHGEQCSTRCRSSTPPGSLSGKSLACGDPSRVRHGGQSGAPIQWRPFAQTSRPCFWLMKSNRLKTAALEQLRDFYESSTGRPRSPAENGGLGMGRSGGWGK